MYRIIMMKTYPRRLKTAGMFPALLHPFLPAIMYETYTFIDPKRVFVYDSYQKKIRRRNSFFCGHICFSNCLTNKRF